MPFFKVDGNLLLSGPAVYGPGFSLLPEQHSTYTYPFHDWYWFDTPEQAVNELVLKKPPVVTVSRRQAELALYQKGVLDIVEGVVAQQPRDVQISYNRASEFKRTDVMLNSVCKIVLGWSDAQIDELFDIASNIPS